MDKNIIVFDFDKTLTYKDTLTHFYIFTAKKNFLFPLKFSFYIFLMICCKFQIISNDYLKNKGFNLFMRGLTMNYLELKAENFASKIKFNKLYKSFNFNTNKEKVIIVSASYELYLKYLFPSNVEIIGSTFISINNVAKEFDFNCYGTNKRTVLIKKDILNITNFYTDSYSDKSLVDLSQKVIIVNRDELFESNNINEFNLYFKK